MKHLKSIGFTNRLAIYCILILSVGLFGGFYLAVKSIDMSYTGSLFCWTVVFTPIGTALSIVLSRVVDKNRAENTGAGSKEGEGMEYARVVAEINTDSPKI